MGDETENRFLLRCSFTDNVEMNYHVQYLRTSVISRQRHQLHHHGTLWRSNPMESRFFFWAEKLHCRFRIEHGRENVKPRH